MNGTAFLIGLTIALGYYFYIMRRQRADYRRKQLPAQGRAYTQASFGPKGED